jgi:hypothetical protein
MSVTSPGTTASIGIEHEPVKAGPEQRAAVTAERSRWMLLLCILLAPLATHAELKPEAKAAYQKYIASLETRLEAQDHSRTDFLWIDRDAARLQLVRGGGIATAQVTSFEVPGGMVQHWIGGVFLPGATLAKVEHVDQDYADYARLYAPDISRPKVLEHNGDHFVVSYRITKKKILTAVMDTVHAIDYIPLAPDRMAIRSRSESVRQVEDAGTSSEKVLPEGEGSGFLWAMNSYWRMEERDGGVYIECEAVTLSRGVPFGMKHLVNPILQSFAEESLKGAIEAKRRAVAAAK